MNYYKQELEKNKDLNFISDIEQKNSSLGDEILSLKNEKEAYAKELENQKAEKTIPWAGLCAQIGVRATGNYEKDYIAFLEAVNLLSQSAIDGQAMTYFAGLKTEANRVFAENNPEKQQQNTQTFSDFQKKILY